MPAQASEFLFSQDIVPLSIKSRLGSDLEVRPLAASDLGRGHLELLSVLTSAPALSEEDYAARFASLKACLNSYFTIVVVEKASDKLVACGTVFVERKFLRNAGIVAHIEDIAVSKTMQGRKLGLLIINGLEEIARSQGCYKVILDCSKENIPFYEKCGFKHKEYEMARYLDESTTQAAVHSRL